MDELLTTIGSQAMKFAIRSGIAFTSRYALSQCSRLLTSVEDEDTPGCEKGELTSLKNLLESKIKVIAPTIDLVEFKSGRGNIFLDSALPLTKSLHRDIITLGQRMESVVADIAHMANDATRQQRQVKFVVADIRELLLRIDREIPLLQLAITASGESLSSSLPTGTSPSRLLQASTLLTFADSKFSQEPDVRIQIGPEFCLSLYMLFLAHAPSPNQGANSHSTPTYEGSKERDRPYGIGDGDRKPIWQEVIHKARVRLHRAPHQATARADSPPLEYSYHLDIVEDEDDGRVHDAEIADPGRKSRGIEERLPVRQVSKIFYTDSGRLLNIGEETQEEKKPVLLIKRDVSSRFDTTELNPFGQFKEHEDDRSFTDSEAQEDPQAELDRQLLGDQAFGQPGSGTQTSRENNRFPRHLDPEWIAMEMFEQPLDNDEASSTASDTDREESSLKSPWNGRAHSTTERLESKSDGLSLWSTGNLDSAPNETQPAASPLVARSPFGGITTSLSLIEMLIRLASLQEFQQASHLTIPDHILAFFLEETSTTGLVGEAQWKARREAKTRVGFDPYSDNAAGCD